MKNNSFNLVRENISLNKVLKHRFEELKLRPTDIVNDAKLLGNTAINKSNLSIYLSGEFNRRGTLSDKHIFWLCCRYNISISLNIKKLLYDKKKGIEEIDKYFKRDVEKTS